MIFDVIYTNIIIIYKYLHIRKQTSFKSHKINNTIFNNAIATQTFDVTNYQ